MRERLTYNAVTLIIGITLVGLMGCQPAPPNLTPDAQAAFQASRVITVLDVVRDAAISANALAPATFSTGDTRNVVVWHQTAVKVIQAAPGGWKATVRQSLYQLTCLPAALDVPTIVPCVSPLSASAVTKITPYASLALVVIAEVK